MDAPYRGVLRRAIGRERVSLAVRLRCKNPSAITTTFAIRFATRVSGLWIGLSIIAETIDSVEKVHEVAFAHSAKRQNDLEATSRNQLPLKRLPILALNGSVENSSTPSKLSAMASCKYAHRLR
jgi:hypothetical protein